MMFIGLTALYFLNGFQLNIVQASFLSGCFLVSFVFHSGYFSERALNVPWDEYLNKKINPVLKVCDQHGWDISSKNSIESLATSDQIHFNGKDYDILTREMSDLEYNHSKDMIRHNAKGEIDYDHACALRIVTLIGALAGFDEYEGIVTKKSRDYDMAGFDWVSFERLKNLCVVIRNQWKMDKM